jgi:acid stress-induced BolA-like protein IbaG/YrbA
MSFEVQGPQSSPISLRIREAIEEALPCSELDVQSGSPGHFTIRVVSGAFEGLSRVKQQQLVYAAITDLMSGDDAPVHAVDSLVCQPG